MIIEIEQEILPTVIRVKYHYADGASGEISITNLGVTQDQDSIFFRKEALDDMGQINQYDLPSAHWSLRQYFEFGRRYAAWKERAQILSDIADFLDRE